MKRLAAAMVLCMLIVVAGPWTSAGEKPKGQQPTKEELKVFELTNQERKKKELKPLVLSPALCRLARAHSENMALQDKMDHVLDGKTLFDRLRDARYSVGKAGENVGAGDKGTTTEAIVQAWMKSDGHRANILAADYTEIGVGIGSTKDGKLFFTQVFARPMKK